MIHSKIFNTMKLGIITNHTPNKCKPPTIFFLLLFWIKLDPPLSIFHSGRNEVERVWFNHRSTIAYNSTQDLWELISRLLTSLIALFSTSSAIKRISIQLTKLSISQRDQPKHLHSPEFICLDLDQLIQHHYL